MKRTKFYVLAMAVLSLVACNKKNDVTVEKVTVEPATAAVKVGETQQLKAIVAPDGAGTITWESSNAAVASVSESGLVTGIAKGEAYITAKAGSKSAFCTLTVYEEGQTVVTLDQLSLNLIKGETATLVATVQPTDKASSLVWSSDNEAVATVKDGVVTAVAKGTANIKATVDDVEAVCAVKVTDPTGDDETVNHVSLKGSDYFVIQLGEKEVSQIESKMLASFAQNSSDQTGSKNLYVWDGTYNAGATQGKNFYGVTGEGWVSLTVTSVGWSGLGYCCGWGDGKLPAGKETEQQAALADLNKLAVIMDAPDDYYLHVAMKSTDNASHLLVLNGVGNTKGTACIGSKEFNDNGATYQPYADFTRDGSWGEIEIPMSYFTKQGLVYSNNNTAGGVNVLTFLSGGVTGTQLQFDALFIYKKAK